MKRKLDELHLTLGMPLPERSDIPARQPIDAGTDARRGGVLEDPPMRHRIDGKQLNRDSDHRRAMLRNLAAGLFEHGEIETTMPKAKAVQPFVEKHHHPREARALHRPPAGRAEDQ